MFEEVPERVGNWLRAQKPQESESGLSWPDPMTDEAAKNILAVVAKQKRDTLSVGLGNPEHPGHV